MAHYPFRTDGYYPRDCWYIAAWSHEVGRSIFARTIFGERVAMFRTTDGAVAAISGICPHRLLPFEHGALVGDAVQCGYHGLQFDKTGACIAAPGQETPPKAQLKTYPVVERWKWVWVWMGDPAKADESLLPELGDVHLGQPGWETMENIVFHLPARAQIYLENIFDLSHIAFLHLPAFAESAAEIGATDVEERTTMFFEPLKISRNGGQLTVSREMTYRKTPQALRITFPHAPEAAAVETATHMLSPALVDGGRARVASGGASFDQADTETLHILHGITPESERSTHVFMVMNRNYALGDVGFAARLRRLNTNVMNEDLQALGAIEPVASGADLESEISVQADAGGLQARRHIERMIMAEAN